MTTRFKNAIDALVYAFFNDTLGKGHCAACALGNIVAWSHGYKKKHIKDACRIPGTMYQSDDWTEAVWHRGQEEDDLLVIEKTGYSSEELDRVETAFEGATRISVLAYHKYSKSEIMEDQYKGLMAVCEVLCDIEGIEDPQEYKELFAYQV